jgi:hypothetical protein
MTGVLVLDTGASLLLQPVNSIRLQRRIISLLCDLCGPLWSSALKNFLNAENAEDRKDRREVISELFVSIVLSRATFIWLLRQRFAGHTIFAFDPLAQVDKLATLRTEGTKRIVFPLDWLTAGWTFHES